MTSISKDRVVEALRTVYGPDRSGNIVDLGLVAESDISVSGDQVIIAVKVPAERARELEPMRAAVEEVVAAVPGVSKVMAALTAERRTGTPGPGGGAPGRPPGGGGAANQPAPTIPGAGIGGVQAIIAVASGKGGVGKSTTAVNLALALQANRKRVGILDADIYGPSMPRLLQVEGRPEPVAGRVLKPMEAYGLKAMSMGFLVEEDTPMIWRGPMVISALTQMLNEVVWGTLDILVVDMPPGTGDAQLTMAQQVPLAGAIIVSTPQDLALIDARKGLNMFRRTEVPVLGLIENMSFFICPHCGEQSDIFGHGGAEVEAERIGVPFLGAVPLEMAVREHSDAGTPIVNAEPDGAVTAIYSAIAERVLAALEAARGPEGRQAPRIVVE